MYSLYQYNSSKCSVKRYIVKWNAVLMREHFHNIMGVVTNVSQNIMIF